MTDKIIGEREKEALKTCLTEYVGSITEPSKGAGMYVCPLCGSGTGANKTGAFSITETGTQWTCFSCGEGGDIFDLIGKYENRSDFNDQIQIAAGLYGSGGNTTSSTTRKRRESSPEPSPEVKKYIQESAAAASETDYFSRRGLSEDTVQRFSLGFDKGRKAAVIPYNANHSYYSRRYIEGKRHEKPSVEEAGKEPLFNGGALRNAELPCFITEGALDAISIMQESKQRASAIAVGGTGGYRKLLKELQLMQQANTAIPFLVLSFDLDEAGQATSEKVATGLNGLGIAFKKAQYSAEDAKDPNEMLLKNREAFIEDIQSNILEIKTEAEIELELKQAKHQSASAANRLTAFIEDIQSGEGGNFVPTGYKGLDDMLDGGLYAGLYILGAISSLGKTTLMLQIADQIAAGGHDVLYFSLEMAATELISKSISRHTYELCQGNTRNAKTSRQISTPKRYQEFSNEERSLTHQAIAKYKRYADRLYLYEGIGDIGHAQLRKTVQLHIELTGNTPVIFIDYLQILAPNDPRASDKQNTDKSVLELKRLSRDLKAPVFAISSFNRDSYVSDVGMDAFKESGAIEYGSDVLMAIQPQGMTKGRGSTDNNREQIEKCKSGDIRHLELKILKNRNGRISGSDSGKIYFNYRPLFNLFEEGEKAEEDTPFTRLDKIN